VIKRKNIKFKEQDPLANGLSDDIAAEQQESDAFTMDDMSPDELTKQWNAIVKDIEKDPDWFSFSKD
jgi:hypothetical protein